jgi:hypothetical protein
LTIDDTKTATFAGTVALGSNNLTTTGAIGTSGATITNGVTATTQTGGDNTTKIATTAYVDSGVSLAAQGLTVLTDVVGVSTANDNGASGGSAWVYANGSSGVGATLTQGANGVVTIDGVATDTVNDRFLIKGQTDAEENGIYLVKTASASDAALVLERTLDMNQISDTYANAFIFVTGGTSYGATSWVCTFDEAVGPTMGTTEINFAQFNAAGAITSGNGLNKSGNDIFLDVSGLSNTLTAVDQADYVVVSDESATDDESKKITFSNFEDEIFGNISGDITIAAGGSSTLGTATVANSMLENMAASTVKVRNANDAGAPSDVALTTTQLLIGNGSGFTAAALSGDVAMTNAGVVTVSGAGSFDLDGDIDSLTQATDWDLMDNQASALSFDTAGKAGILNIVTTTSSEGVEMSGDCDITGTLTAGTFAPAALSATGKLSVNINAPTVAASADGSHIHMEGGDKVTLSDSAGTVAKYNMASFEASTVGASNASVVVTKAATVYISGPPTVHGSGTVPVFTDSYALYCNGAIGGATISGGSF